MCPATSSDFQPGGGSLPGLIISKVRQSFLLSIAGLGVLLIAIGYTLEILAMVGKPLESGVIAGMMAIWGASMFLCGLIGYISIQYSRNY